MITREKLNCFQCGLQPLSNFTEYNIKKDVAKICKNCTQINNRKYYLANKEKIKEDTKKYKEENKEKVQQFQKDYVLNNKQRVITQRKKYYAENRDSILEEKREYYFENKRKILDTHNEYHHKKKTDPIYKLKRVLRSRLHKLVTSINAKDISSLKLVGCSIEELRIYLESKFSEGMTWHNHGFGKDKWHVDHIIPCAAFDLSNAAAQQACFHYTNLQPLWQSDNLSKGDKYE